MQTCNVFVILQATKDSKIVIIVTTIRLLASNVPNYLTQCNTAFLFQILLVAEMKIITSLESSAAWYSIVEEWFVEEQGTFAVIVLVVEVFARRQVQTFRRALALVTVLYGVRCVRAAHSCVRVICLPYLRCHRDHNYQLG